MSLCCKSSDERIRLRPNTLSHVLTWRFAKSCATPHVSASPSSSTFIMILRVATLIAACAFWIGVSAGAAPEITVVSEGYNIIAKVPCVGCLFVYQDSLEGQDGPWKTRDDGNALVGHRLFFSRWLDLPDSSSSTFPSPTTPNT
jgi:hypothetical protein